MLKSLELIGFKSFADRTQFDFAPGITGVVGPNGSGKSNVVDAIKWILGDQSAKSLRGKEMTDVIFNGAAGRKPSGLAEATLTFDNSTGFLPVDAPEVQIGRRIWRSGDAEYLINKGSARLKDVRDLFLGTGAGASAYCIIEQGRVDQILQANATNRRMVFEEAAGISRFKARRINAERNLERVDQNLLRLTDIVDEVEAQLNSLRSQAVKAAKYREISARLREWWLGLASDQFRAENARLKLVDEQIHRQQRLVEELNGRLTALEQSLSGLDAEISEVDDRLRAAERRSAGNREQVAGLETSLRHQTARKNELEADLARLRKQRTTMATRAEEASAELDRAREQLAKLDEEFRQKKQGLQAHETAIATILDKNGVRKKSIEQAKEDLAAAMRGVSESSNLTTQSQSALESARNAIGLGESRAFEIEERIQALQAECEIRREHLRAANEQLAVAGDRLRALQSDRKTLLGKQDRFQKSLSQLREQRSAWQARKSVLEDLESRQEGLGLGVKEILSRAQTSDLAPWNQVLGSVAYLLDVDLEQAALLEVALGPRAQLIVLEEFDALLDYIQRATVPIQGRVGFIALHDRSVVRPRQGVKVVGKRPSGYLQFEHFPLPAETGPDLSNAPGVMRRADGIVKSSGKAAGLARQLLADTWIVDSLETALQLATNSGRGCRFVTLQGELLDADGTLTVGTLRSETAVVSRRSELRRLKQDLDDLDDRITEEEGRLTGLGSTLSEADSSLNEAESAVKLCVDQHAEIKSDLATHERELERYCQEFEEARCEVTTAREQAARLETEVEKARGLLAEREANARALQDSIARFDRELADSEQRLLAHRERLNTDKVELAATEERVQGLRTACERLEQDLSQRHQQREESERRFAATTEQRRQISLQILNASASLAEQMLSQDRCVQEVSLLLSERDTLRGKRSILLKEEAGLREQRRIAGDEQHQAEMQSRDIRHQITGLEQRIEEEYQLKLSDVVAEGASAVRLYLEEMREKKNKKSGRNGESAVVETDSAEIDDVESADDSRDHEPSDLSAVQDGGVEIQFEDVREELESRVNRLRRQLKLMGSVNTDSLRDLDELERRFGYLSEQLEDLVQAKRALEEIVQRINTESERMFAEAFESIRGYFQELFRKLFGGGEGDVILEDPNDMLECGIDIVARPPGKELRSISLLSGGEKTLTAVALLLSIFKSKPSPFCILDEVDAALDEANVDRFVALLREFRETTQFIMITHSKRSMTVADRLYGVTMEQSGVSKRMSVRFEDVGENGELNSAGGSAVGKDKRRGKDAA